MRNLYWENREYRENWDKKYENVDKKLERKKLKRASEKLREKVLLLLVVDPGVLFPHVFHIIAGVFLVLMKPRDLVLQLLHL